MKLLERDALLKQLQAQLDQAVHEAGRLVFIAGEAGIGKTALLQRFAAVQPEDLPVYWGHNDALQTPCALGALDDIAAQTGGELKALMDGHADPHRLHVAFLDLLAVRPALVVLEDMHWADGGTLDLLRYAGRRMERTRSLLVVSFRDDELVPAHPLRTLLGDLATCRALRLQPAPLSVDAVRTLCSEAAVDPVQLHRLTAGNPFFVTEVLASNASLRQSHVPQSVSDAVLARIARRSPSARELLEAAAVGGPRIEAWLLQAVTHVDRAMLDECLATGVLNGEGAVFSFRHELARQAVLQAMTPTVRTQLHGRVLQALLSTQRSRIDPARLVHHASVAGDAAAVRRWAVEAAHEAAARGAHRQAASHWASLAEHAQDDEQRAGALDEYSVQVQMSGGLAESIEARRESAALWRQRGETERAAAALARLALLLVLAGRNADGESAMLQARQLIPPGTNSPQAWLVQRSAAHLRMLDGDSEQALTLITPALAAAEGGGDTTPVIQCLITLGSALLELERVDDGAAAMERSLVLAERLHNDQLMGMTFANLGSCCAAILRLELAERALQRGIAFCALRDLDAPRLYQLSWLAIVRLHQGRWDEAENLANEVCENPRATPIARIMALLALGRLRARRGAAGVWAVLDEARDLAERTGTLQRVVPMRAARAEAAWLEGRDDATALEAGLGLALARAKGHERSINEMALWCMRGGVAAEFSASGRLDANALEGTHQWCRASQAWAELGCSFERARALADGDEAAQREALAVFESLGAQPMVERVRRQLRAAGARRIPRGPRASTREQPAGLTHKEIEVLTLLVAGLRNKDIGQRIHRSPRTVDHHLQSIYAKLGVATRVDAVRAARRLGVVVDEANGLPH